MAVVGPSSTVTSTTVPLTVGVWGPREPNSSAVRWARSMVSSPTSRTVAPRLALSSVGRPLGDDVAVVDDHQIGGQPVGLLEVLGGEEHGGAPADQALDDLPQVVAALGVEPGGWLVQEEHGGPGHQGGGQVEPSSHTTRVRLERAVAGVVQGELPEQFGGPAGHVGGVEVVEPAHHAEVLPAGEVLVHGGVLAGQPDQAADQSGLLPDVVTQHPGRTAVGLQDGGEDPDGGGLAGPVGAEEAEHPSLLDVEGDPVEGADLVFPGEGLLEGVGFDGVRHGREDPDWSAEFGRGGVTPRGGPELSARPRWGGSRRRPGSYGGGGPRPYRPVGRPGTPPDGGR